MALHDVDVDIDQTLAIDCRMFGSLEESRPLFASVNSFKFMTLNIRSLQRNFDAFEVAFKRMNIDYDAIILTECWLNEYSLISQLPGYNAFNTSKFINKSGGVVIYIKESLSVSVSEPNIVDANCLAVTISDRFKIFGIYRSPSFLNTNNFLNSLDEILKDVKGFSTVVILGDINIDIMDSSTNQSSDYLCLLTMYEFLPAITLPTRNDSCLDHIFIKTKSRSAGAVCQCSITDHNIAMATIAIPVSKDNQRSRLMLQTNYAAAALDLRAAEWSKVLGCTDVNEAVAHFDLLISTAIKNNTRQVKISRSKLILKPWITPGLIRCMRHRDRLHSRARASPNDSALQITYRRYRNFFDNLLYKIKLDYQGRKLAAAKDNPKKLWKSIKNICHNPVNSFSANDLTTLTTSPKDSLNICNEHFATVGQKLATSILSKLSGTQSSLADQVPSSLLSGSLFLHPTDVGEVNKIISQLRSDSAPGPDGIGPSFIKEVKDILLEPLTYICNLSLATGCFPDSWKLAQVSPIYKNGHRSDPNNYRPISLLSVFSKILEKIVNTRLTAFFDKYNLISNSQFGFRRGKSTEDAIVQLSNKISAYLDRGDKCVGVFLDLAKAFDTVSRDILLKKLEAFGVRGVTLEWFRSYLTNRRQTVRVGNLTSDQLPIDFGVPQGSILGPTLFLAYINDILSLNLPQADLICYADDTVVLFHDRSWEGLLGLAESGLADILSWLDNNLLTLNVGKSNYLAFSKTAASSGVHLDDLIIHSGTCITSVDGTSACSCGKIVRSETVKYLGLIIDHNLSFRHHIAALSNKVRKCIYVMKKLRNCATEQVLRIVYYALCQSSLQYCISVWGSAAKTILLQLERAQRAVIKVMLKKPFRFPTDTLYRNSKLLSVRRLYILKAVLRAHSVVATLPTYTQLLTKRVFRVPLPKTRSAFVKRFPAYMHLRLYNSVCKVLSIQSFTRSKLVLVVRKWLETLSYGDTEVLISIGP